MLGTKHLLGPEQDTGKRDLLDLAILRNKLEHGTFSERERKLLLDVNRQVAKQGTPFQKLFMFALSNAERDIDAGHLEEASNEINFIHNLPSTTDELRSWDDEYFYTVELPAYLRRSGSCERNRAVVRLVAQEQLAQDHA